LSYRIVLTPTARERLEAITDRRIRQKIGEGIDGLREAPASQGKALLGELAGYRSLRGAGQRYRIIYSVDRHKNQVLILAIGLRQQGGRRDVYSLAKKLLRLRLLEPPGR
jgi:mRNA interferase RelE/StbE